jgi:hypothetical protein
MFNPVSNLIFSWEVLSTCTRLGFTLVVAVVVNIVVETGVLKILFFKATMLRRLIGVSAVMNLASYAVLILYFVSLFAPQLAAKDNGTRSDRWT